MASLFSLDDVKNRPHRSSFDLQSKRAFTAKAGELLPVYWTMTMPGDKFKLRNAWFTRTQPVQTSAFTRIREYYDYFFVPLRQLWKQAPQSVMQMTENSTAASSSVQSASVGTMLPQLTLGELYSCLNSTSSSPVFGETTNPLGYKRGDLAVKLLRYLGYGNIMSSGYTRNYGTTNTVDDYNQAYGSNVYVNILPILAYQKIYNDFFRDTQWENSTPYTFNVDYWSGSGSFYTSLLNQVSNVGTLGRTILDMGYCNWNKDLFMGVRPTSQYGDVAVVTISDAGVGGTQTVSLSGGIQNFAGHLSFVTPTSGSEGDYNPLLVRGRTSAGGFADSVVIPESGDLLNGNYYIRGNGSSVRFTEGSSLYVPLVNADGQATFTNTSSQVKNWQNATLQSEASAQTLEFNILALRQAEALQKWKEITLSGDQTYRDQVYKHFGVSLPSEMSDLVRYIGGSFGNLDISEVVNTTFGENIGGGTADIKGKGTGSGNSKEFDFEAKEHGILMCVYHATPILDYDVSGQDPLLLITSSEDLPIPEFDNLGMQEVPMVSVMNNVSSPAFASSYLGYAPRYYPFKTSIDRVFGAFSTTLRDWVAPVDDAFMSPFVTASGSTVTFPLSYNFFKVNPAILNNIFALSADGTWDTDQFLVNSQFDVRVARNLSVTGLPY